MNSKKLVSFSRIIEINKVIKDLATTQNKTESEVIEDVLLKSLMPQNEDARFLVEATIYRNDASEDEQNDVEVLLQSLFASNAAGVKNWSAKHDNYLPLVEFAKRQTCLYNRHQLSGEERELPHLILQLQTMIDNKLQGAEKEYASALLAELQEEPQYSRLGNFYQLILNSWDSLSGWSITYRLLADLVAIDNWVNTASVRIELLHIVKQVSEAWN